MPERQKIGKFGETLAKNYLLKKGYRIIDTNVKISFQEIDIICFLKGEYIFVEVKTRTTDSYGQAEEAVDKRKLNNLKKAILIYFQNKNLYIENVRIDIIAIEINIFKNIAKIRHYINIY